MLVNEECHRDNKILIMCNFVFFQFSSVQRLFTNVVIKHNIFKISSSLEFPHKVHFAGLLSDTNHIFLYAIPATKLSQAQSIL